MNDDVVLADPWEDLRNPGGEHRELVSGLETELRTEVSEGHPLFGRAFRIVGRSHAADDVLVTVDGGWALVHLTWSRHAERPPWPTSTEFRRARDVETAMDLL